MTLREYKELFDNFISLNPDALDLDVVHSSDDEGNEFNLVIFGPTLGHYSQSDKMFIDIKNPDYLDDFGINPDSDPNAVCIN